MVRGNSRLGDLNTGQLHAVTLKYGEQRGRQALSESFFAYRLQNSFCIRRAFPDGGAPWLGDDIEVVCRLVDFIKHVLRSDVPLLGGTT